MDETLRKDEQILHYISKVKQKGIKEAWKDEKGYWVTVNDGYEASRSNDKSVIFATNLTDLQHQMYGIRLIDEPIVTNIIRNIRAVTNMTQAEFAVFLDIPLRNIENWEGNKSTPPDYLVKLISYKVRTQTMPKPPYKTVTLSLDNLAEGFNTYNLCYGEKIVVDDVGEFLLFDSSDRLVCNTEDTLEVFGVNETTRVITLSNSRHRTFDLTIEEFNILTNDCFCLAEMGETTKKQ